METVIVAFENGTMAQRFGELLENTAPGTRSAV